MSNVNENFENNCLTLASYNGGFWADENGKLSGISRFNFLGRLWFWVKDKWSKGHESQKVHAVMEKVLKDSQTKIESGEQIFLMRRGSIFFNRGAESYVRVACQISIWQPDLKETAEGVGRVAEEEFGKMTKLNDLLPNDRTVLFTHFLEHVTRNIYCEMRGLDTIEGRQERALSEIRNIAMGVFDQKDLGHNCEQHDVADHLQRKDYTVRT